MFNKHAKASGIYRINDNIEKFEFTIYFRHINSILKLPQFHLDQVLKGNASYNRKADDEQNDIKVTTIKWQQKIFSANERELYKDAQNCHTAQQKHYYELLKKQQQVFETQSHKKKTKTKKTRKQQQKLLEQQPLNELLPPQTTGTGTKSSEFEIFTYIAADDYTPSDDYLEQPIVLKNPLEPCIAMYVYVGLQPDTQLVAFKWYPTQKLMHVYPNFNNMTENPYFIEIDNDYRDFFAYALENNSKTRVAAAELPKLDVAHLLQLPREHALPYWKAREALAQLFEMPPKRTQRLALLFDIKQARQFSYDNLHVRYHIRLPARTKHEEGLLVAATHTASAANGTAQFGYNWQVTLLCLEDFEPSSLLHIYFEVISIDGWERERIEGYAHYATYLMPGAEHVQLVCIRPAESLRDKLQRYFVGGRRNFNFERYFALNAEKQQFWSRYRCRMEQTGLLKFSVAKIMQSSCDLLQPCNADRKNGMTLDDIMMAYREARNRLQDLVL